MRSLPAVTSVKRLIRGLREDSAFIDHRYRMTGIKQSIEERIDRLQTGGIIDMHFDLPMDLYEKRQRRDVLETEFLPEFEAGNVSVVGAAIYIEDRYLPGTVCAWRSIKLHGCMPKQQRRSASRFAKVIAKFRRREKRARSRFSSRWKESSRWAPT